MLWPRNNAAQCKRDNELVYIKGKKKLKIEFYQYSGNIVLTCKNIKMCWLFFLDCLVQCTESKKENNNKMYWSYVFILLILHEEYLFMVNENAMKM